jgi:hypothetical protein
MPLFKRTIIRVLGLRFIRVTRVIGVVAGRVGVYLFGVG